MFASEFGLEAEATAQTTSRLRRLPLLVLFGFVLLSGVSCSTPQDKAGTTPQAGNAADLRGAFADHNLLLITIDTLRADRLGSYGHSAARTPYLDRLAREGVRFENVYSAVPLTLPSHGVLFTGRYPYAIQVRTNGSYVLGEEEITLAEQLQQRGFATSATVASYVLSSKFGLDQGFDTYNDALGDGSLLRTFTSEISAEKVYARFEHQMVEKEESKPFFSWVHFYDPHEPYAPPAEFALSDPYDGEIAYVDHQVGRILNFLEKQDLLDKTLILVTSDHGEGFGEHLEEGHGLFAYEETLRVPMIAFAPGLLPVATVRQRIGLVDVLPTLMELYDLESSGDLQGQSFASLLLGENGPDPQPAYFESLLGQEDKNWAPLTGLIDGPFKYIALPEPELYHLEQDPGETQNLVESERRTFRRLDDALRQMLLQREASDSQNRRELSEEDRRHLESLGYLSASGRALQQLDPKQGIRIDLALDEARALLSSGNAGGASSRLDAILSEHPEVQMPDFFMLRYEIEVARQRPEPALAALSEGMRTFPDLEPIPFQKAAYLIELGRHNEAEVLCQALLDRNPRFANAWILRARSAEAQQNNASAILAYEEALAIEPGHFSVRLRLADLHLRARQLPEARALYDSLYEDGSLDERPDELYRLAMLDGQQGDFKRAEKLFRQGLEMAPAGVHRLSLAILLDQGQKRTEAIAEMERALNEHAAELSPPQLQLARQTLARWRGEEG